MRRVAAGAVRYGMCSAVFVMAFSGTSYADTTASLSSLADQARVEAHKWRADAEFVQVELLAFGFGIGPSGYPDVNKTGPPGGALFHFRSPSSQHALRMSADMSRGTLRAVPLSAPVSSYTRGIPADVSLDFDKAIAQAKAALGTECIGGDPLASRSCTVVTGADLHMETDGSTLSSGIWTSRFGQNPRTLRGVSRSVDARTGQSTRMRRMSGRSSSRTRAESWRFPKSEPCIIGTSASRVVQLHPHRRRSASSRCLAMRRSPAIPTSLDCAPTV